jgi:DNA-binding GntR family transcriptional regulator
VQEVSQIKRPATLNELAYKEIKNLLITGQLKYNTLYSANQFAEILGVSRTPIREALLQLANEGCLISVQGQGFKIKEYSEKEIRDFFEARKMIESYVIQQLIKSSPVLDIRPLEENVKLMTELAKDRGDTYGFLEADKSFHLSLVQQYNNFLLVSYIQNIRDLISLFGGKTLSHKERFDEVIYEHNGILEALKEKNEKKGIESVAYHLDMTEKYLLEGLNK